jgi:hypothetical protein
MILFNEIEYQFNYVGQRYAARYGRNPFDLEEMLTEKLEDRVVNQGLSLKDAYAETLGDVLQVMGTEYTRGGVKHFFSSPVWSEGQSISDWVLSIKAGELVDAFFGYATPSPNREQFVKYIEEGALSRQDFVGAFLTAKATDGIQIPSVDDVLSRSTKLYLTPDTLQFDADHALTHIYLGAFGRAPDGDGLAYWKAKAAEIGIERTTEALYQGGLQNGELNENLESAAFVTQFYQSILGRAPDADGLAFWVGKLDAGLLARGFAIYAFVQGISDGRDAKFVNNKALVAQAFADATVGKPATEALLNAAQTVLANVNEKDVSALLALENIGEGHLLRAAGVTAKLASPYALVTDADLLFADDDSHAATEADADDALDATHVALVGNPADDAQVLL